MFFPYRHKETGEEIVLYYKDKKFEQKNARNALGYITEEFTDLTPEEAVMQQNELLAQIKAEANTSKGRGKRGGRSVRARERGRGRGGRTSGSRQVTAFNSTFLNFLSREGYVNVQGNEKDKEVRKPEELIIPRKKRSATDIDQVDTSNQNVTLDAGTNPEVKGDPNVVNLITDFNSDEKMIKALNESTPSLVITPNILEADEKEKIDRGKSHQACKKYLQRVLKSKRELWHKTEGKTDDLSSNYAPFGKKNRRWKDIHEDVDKSIKKPSWVVYNEKLKLIKSRTRGGIGHSSMEILESDLLDTDTLIENLGERISPSHLEKVEAMKIVHRKINDNDVREEILPDHKDVSLSFVLIDDLEISKSSISKLRSAIYQLGEDTEEKRELKKKLVKVLRDKEEERLNNFLGPTVKEAQDLAVRMSSGSDVPLGFGFMRQAQFSGGGDGNGGVGGGHDEEDVQSQLAEAVVRQLHEEVGGEGEGDGDGEQGVEEPQ
ncbi:hypothetical protein AgCh_027836 [Apium graveolens]